MNPGIFLIQDNEVLIEMNEQPYDSEKLLQTWLAKYPELLVGSQIDAMKPRRFLLIEQECGIPSKEGAVDRWKIDHIYLDQESVPTLIHEIPGVSLPEDSVERFPSIPLSLLAQGDNVRRFLDAIDWVNEQVIKTRS